MAKDDTNVQKPSGEVDDIRKILFGDQIAQIEERFNQNENAISQLRTENRNLRQALEAEVTTRENTLRELHELLDAFKKSQHASWQKNTEAQNALVSAIESAIQEFKAAIAGQDK